MAGFSFGGGSISTPQTTNLFAAQPNTYAPTYGVSSSNSSPISSSGSGTGYSVVQPDGANTPFQVVQPQVFPTASTSNTSNSSSGSNQGSGSSSSNLSGNRNSNTNSSSTTNDSSTSHRTGTNVTTGQSSSIIDRLDPASRAAYNELLGVLTSGGTDAMKTGMAALESLLQRSQDAEEEFTSDNARAQAQRSTGKYARELREQVMPAIYGAQEGAGVSGNSMTALLAQDQAARVAENAAAAELSAIQAYGELAQGQQGVTRDTAMDLANDPAAKALSDLLEIGKGAYESSETNSIVTEIINELTQNNGTSTTTGTSTTNENYSEDTSAQNNYQENSNQDGQSSITGTQSYTQLGESDNSGALSGFSAGGSEDESLATLMASLGPYQTLQDATGGSNPLNSFMTGRGQSGANIQALAAALGVQL